MPRTRTRVLNRTRPHDPDYPPARAAYLRRKIRKKLARYFAEQDRRAAARAAAEQQKAPGLATGGSLQSADEAKDQD